MIEAVISLAIGAILVGAAASTIALVLRANADAKNFQIASLLAQELWNNLSVLGESDWHNLDDLSSGASYYTATTTGGEIQWRQVASGETGEKVMAEGAEYTRWFTLAGVGDPSARKVTIKVQWKKGGEPAELTFIGYLSRFRNEITYMTDWSGGPAGERDPLSLPDNKFSSADAKMDYSGLPGALKISGYAPSP